LNEAVNLDACIGANEGARTASDAGLRVESVGKVISAVVDLRGAESQD